MSFYILQTFNGEYPPEAADWCNQNMAMIVALGDGTYEIQGAPAQSETDKIKAEIANLEAQQTPRRIREAALTEAGKAWLQTLEDKIEVLRAKLSTLG